MTGDNNMTQKSQVASTATSIYDVLARLAANGEQGVLATVIQASQSTPRHAGSKMIIHGDGRVTGSVGGGPVEAQVVATAVQVLADGQCQKLSMDLTGKLGVCGGSMEIFLEPIHRNVPFLIIGAGHVGRALVELGKSLSFHFTLVDDRPEYMSDLGDQPGLSTHQADPAALKDLDIACQGAALVVSRSHQLDGDYLEQLMMMEQTQGREFKFFGMLGSRSKTAVLHKRFSQNPALAERMLRLQLPVGVSNGSETPAEIALSIFAEAMAVLRDVPQITDEQGHTSGLYLQRTRPRIKPADGTGSQS